MRTHNDASALAADDGGRDWVQAHAALSRLARERAALDAEEGRWLLCAWRSAAHRHLGYGSFAQYVESLFGYKPRTTQEKLRVAEALEVLPRVARALEAGALSWCSVRELTRVALPQTEPAWLDAARGKTLRELEALVANKAPGDSPDPPATELSRPRVLRFEVAADAAVLDMATCDAQQLGELLPSAVAPRPANENASLDVTPAHQSSSHAHVGAVADIPPSPRAKQKIPPALRRAVLTRDRRRCRLPGCTHATFIDVHHLQPRAEGGRNEASNLLTLCGAHHRATHHGELLIERDSDGSFTFRHANGAAYGTPTTPRLIDAHSKVFSALRHLGFREGEVKAVLAELRGDPELAGETVERLLREALCRIRSTAR